MTLRAGLAAAAALAPGAGTFELGLFAQPGVLGASARALKRWDRVYGFAEGKAGVSLLTMTPDWQAVIGLGGRF